MSKEVIRDTSWVFVISFVTFGIAGALWGWFYPTVQIAIDNDGQLTPIKGTASSGFAGFAWFVLVTCALSLVITVWTFMTRIRSAWMMLWTSVVVFAATWWFYSIGTSVIAATEEEVPEHPSPGDTLSVVELSAPGVGLIAAATVALLIYWFATVFSDNSSFSRADSD